MKNIIGNKYNKLTVLELERKEKRNNHWRYYYKCKCDCGKIKTLERDSIVFGGAKSCGCAFKGMNAKHNLSSTRDIGLGCTLRILAHYLVFFLCKKCKKSKKKY